ncbi:MAG: DEAD/DEAH box helicase [Anaerolineae bacterium]|nr:DEAD/DEAH box helicase [Anaerolineae bacterium]
MNPIDVTRRLKEALIHYLLTTFDVNRDGKNEVLYGAIRDAFEREQALITGPFLEFAQPYKRGKSSEQLIDEGWLSEKLFKLRNPPIPLDAPLYQHQQRAIEQIVKGSSVIVSSGTGSGKTESFLIPILNDLLQHPAGGVRAILIYPLNALVNDQLDRLGKLLDGTNITYGRYTSELSNTTEDWKKQTGQSDVPAQQVISREQIRNGEKIPNILITNYAMLEYLLLRPSDDSLFRYPNDWKYIVLDEAHSYSGAKGIEVAYLIRRLKHHLGKKPCEMVCIGTSATLTNEPLEAVEFAKTLFGEEFTSENIIFGESEYEDLTSTSNYDQSPPLEAYLHHLWDDLLEKLRVNSATVEEVWEFLSEFKLFDDSTDVATEGVPQLLYSILKDNFHIQSLRKLMAETPDTPLELTEAAAHLFPESQTNPVTKSDSIRGLYHLVELATMARPHPDAAALLPARYHVFARSPQGMWVCLNPTCKGRPENSDEKWSYLFGSPRVKCDFCDCAVFPLSVCRTCGQVYIKTIYKNGQYCTELPKTKPDEKLDPRYFVWSKSELNEALDDTDEVENTSSQDIPRIDTQPITICINAECRRESRCDCKTKGLTPRHIQLYPITITHADKKNESSTRTNWVDSLKRCARCGSESRFDEQEIATPITMGGMTPLSVLTMELYRQLPESSDKEIKSKPGAGRKLLSFYDSRQGAARYAAFLQDVFNQDLLRYLLPLTVAELNHPSIDLIDLAEKATEIGWERLNIFQTLLDDEIDEIFEDQFYQRNKPWNKLTSSQRQRLQRFTKVQILAEITTKRRGRQSLESLGLLRVRYFETEPDVSSLADQLGLTDEQTHTVIDYLLDTLRNEKVITLPDGIAEDHPAFGRHQGNSAIVRANPRGGEAPWVGATPRHNRCRIMAIALEANGQNINYQNVSQALYQIWEWLINPELGVMCGSPSEGYRLCLDHLFFDSPTTQWYQCNKCQRLRHGNTALRCPALHCGGEYKEINLQDNFDKNYYYYIFQQGLKPLRVEEHTAQLAPEKAQEYQNRFKQGDINILSCSTTFEMGIDLGDLQAVVMNNVPPNVSNYRQRAGRAGRRVSGTAFIVTWATDRPHDQHYFDAPPEMIRGQVRIPRLTLQNLEIQRRHLNALLLGAFLKYLHQNGANQLDKVGAFFDLQAPNPRHYDQLSSWTHQRSDQLQRKLTEFASFLEGTPLTDDPLRVFLLDLQRAEENYRHSSEIYRNQISKAIEQYTIANEKQSKEWHKQRDEAGKRLTRLNEDALIDTLSGQGILPSYSFPLYTVELELPYNQRGSHKLRLQRDLSRAITEFAPGAEVVADKRLWKSNGVLFKREASQIFMYRICENCGHILVAQTAGAPIMNETCPICHKGYSGKNSNTQYLVPDGFTTDPKNSGKMAGQYVHYEATQTATAVMIPSTNNSEPSTEFVQRSIQTDGKLFYLNSGKRGIGYKLCRKCGRAVSNKKNSNKDSCSDSFCGGGLISVHLGHSVPTDTLLIRFSSLPHKPIPNKLNLDFWITLQTALVLGANRALQIERSDIDAALFPIISGPEWERAIVLFDKVPGGAGYVRDIDQNFPQVVEAALMLVRCPHCTEDTSCTRCLRDYNNQLSYPYLKRGKVISFLEDLQAYLTHQTHPLGVMQLFANNRIAVLWEMIANAKQSIRLALNQIEDVIPVGQNRSWLDLIHQQLQNGVAIELILTNPPNPHNIPHQHRLIEADYLALMMTKGQGLKLKKSSTLPEWHLIIDPESERNRRAIKFDETSPRLDETLSNPRLSTTTQANGIQAAVEGYNQVFQRAKPILVSELEPPSTTRVYRITASSRPTWESGIPAIVEFFEYPVKQMTVNDPYLLDKERIFNRLGAYIELAYAGGALEKVKVITRDAKLEGYDRSSQQKAFNDLKVKARISNITFHEECKTDRSEHDRWIEIVRTDQTKARLFIGRGLDFIRADGTVQATYLVIEELQ